MRTVQWTKDAVAESIMRTFDIEFVESTVQLKDIDWEASLHNQARLSKKVDEHAVAQYRDDMRRGDAFPMTVIIKTPVRTSIAGGVHRSKGVVEIGDLDMPCYLVKTDDPMIVDLLPRALNRKHGLRQAQEDSLLHALHAVDTYGMDVKVAEDRFGVTPGTLWTMIRARKVKEALELSGAKGVEKLSKAALLSLNTIQNENVQVAAANVMARSGMTSVECGDFVKSIRRNRTEQTQLKAIEDTAKRIKAPETAAEREARPIRSTFRRLLSSIENVLAGVKSLRKIQITEKDDAKEIRERLVNLADTLYALAGEGKNGRSH